MDEHGQVEVFDPDDYFFENWDGSEEDADYLPCCVCSCLIGDEVGFGEANYFGDGRPICDQCVDAAPLEGED